MAGWWGGRTFEDRSSGPETRPPYRDLFNPWSPESEEEARKRARMQGLAALAAAIGGSGSLGAGLGQGALAYQQVKDRSIQDWMDQQRELEERRREAEKMKAETERIKAQEEKYRQEMMEQQRAATYYQENFPELAGAPPELARKVAEQKLAGPDYKWHAGMGAFMDPRSGDVGPGQESALREAAENRELNQRVKRSLIAQREESAAGGLPELGFKGKIARDEKNVSRLSAEIYSALEKQMLDPTRIATDKAALSGRLGVSSPVAPEDIARNQMTLTTGELASLSGSPVPEWDNPARKVTLTKSDLKKVAEQAAKQRYYKSDVGSAEKKDFGTVVRGGGSSADTASLAEGAPAKVTVKKPVDESALRAEAEKEAASMVMNDPSVPPEEKQSEIVLVAQMILAEKKKKLGL